MIKLKRQIVFGDNVQPACLNTATSALPENMTATGWGLTEGEKHENVRERQKIDRLCFLFADQDYSRRLQKVLLHPVPMPECISMHQNLTGGRIGLEGLYEEAHLCAMSDDLADTYSVRTTSPNHVPSAHDHSAANLR